MNGSVSQTNPPSLIIPISIPSDVLTDWALLNGLNPLTLRKAWELEGRKITESPH